MKFLSTLIWLLLVQKDGTENTKIWNEGKLPRLMKRRSETTVNYYDTEVGDKKGKHHLTEAVELTIIYHNQLCCQEPEKPTETEHESAVHSR